MEGDGAKSRQNVLMVVMDCVRASDFIGSSGGVDEMPFCEGLRRESYVFERAISPASWTLPAHASLFTGEYPWVHGVHSKGSRALPDDLTTLAEQMAARGYRTLSLSANPFIGGSTGLTRGFDEAAWGNAWERYLRHFPHSPQRQIGSSRRQPVFVGSPVLREIVPWGLRRPFGLNWVNQVTFGLTGKPQDCLRCVSVWIEGELTSWLHSQPSDRPVFVFVNLLEAHEPYLQGAASSENGAPRAHNFVRQDFARWLDGRWSPSGPERDELTTLYRQSIRALDHRIRQLVGCFEEAKRWDSTALILTSDHGQGTGEQNHLSHGMSVDDSITRVPLWVRPSGGALDHKPIRDWVSLTRIPQAVRLLSEYPLPPLDELFAPRPAGAGSADESVLSVSEGIIWSVPHLGNGSDRRSVLDRLLIAGYAQNLKLVYDATGKIWQAFEYDVRGDPSEVPVEHTPAVQQLRVQLGEAARKMMVSALPPSPGTAARLEGWGY